MTPAMVIEIERFRERLPKLPNNDQSFIVGHKVALETVVPNDGSWERSMLSRLILSHAWLIAWRNYVEKCDEKPLSYDDWIKENGT